MDDPLEYANKLLWLVAFECDADKRTKFAQIPGWRFERLDVVAGNYASAMELMQQHARRELRELDAIGL